MGAREDWDRFVELAKELGLDEGEQTESFLESAMTRKGHKKVTSWSDGEPEKKSGGDFFGGSKDKKEYGK